MTGTTFVSVVFDTEVPLLELQARSLRLHVPADAVDAVVVLDNCLYGLGRRRRARLLREYGPHAARVRFVRTRELFDRGGTSGWRSQQAAKLLIAARVDTTDYVTLDAKNHFTRPITSDDFVASDGRAHGAAHSYAQHPLRSSLVETLRYLGADEETTAAAVDRFPPTATPFVLRTAVVRELIADIEASSGSSFADEFETHKLLEFFLYSGWATVRGPGLDSLRDDAPLPSPTVWPRAATVAGVRDTIEEAERTGAFVFAVHRQALAQADSATRDAIADHWVRVGLFARPADAHAFIRRFSRAYLPSLLLTRLAERVHGVTGALRSRLGIRRP